MSNDVIRVIATKSSDALSRKFKTKFDAKLIIDIFVQKQT